MLNFVLLIWSKLRGQFINVEVWRRFCWLLFWEKSLKHIKSSHAAFTCPLLDVRTQCVKIERQLWPSQPQSILWAYGDTRVLTRQNYTCSGSTHTSMTTRPTLFSAKRWWCLQPKRARLRPSPHHPKGLTHGEFLDRASAASEQAQKERLCTTVPQVRGQASFWEDWIWMCLCVLPKKRRKFQDPINENHSVSALLWQMNKPH